MLDRKQAADIAGRQTVRPIAHEKPEDLQSGRLGQRAEQRDSLSSVDS